MQYNDKATQWRPLLVAPRELLRGPQGGPRAPFEKPWPNANLVKSAFFVEISTNDKWRKNQALSAPVKYFLQLMQAQKASKMLFQNTTTDNFVIDTWFKVIADLQSRS